MVGIRLRSVPGKDQPQAGRPLIQQFTNGFPPLGTTLLRPSLRTSSLNAARFPGCPPRAVLEDAVLPIALKMLFGDRGKYLGIVIGIALATVLMIQQPGILISILKTVNGVINDVSGVDIWVMDPMVKSVDDAKPLWPRRTSIPNSTSGRPSRPRRGRGSHPGG